MIEDKNFQEVLDKAKELETIDFKTTDNLDYASYYEAIAKIAKKNDTIKNEEAETVIKLFANKLIDQSYIDELSKKRESLYDFLRKYDPNTELVESMSTYDVDKVYSITNYLVNTYINYINEMLFNFEFTNEEFKFLDKILTKLIEYNGDDVFNYVEFYDNFWEKAKEFYDNNRSDEKFTFNVDIKKILILHHLIKNYKVKGSGLEFKLFRNILYKIAQTNKIFNAYNVIVDRIKNDCKLWGNALDEVTKPHEQLETVSTEQKSE